MGKTSELISMKTGDGKMMAKISERIRLKGGEKPKSFIVTDLNELG